MSTRDPNAVPAQLTSAERGMNSGAEPSIISKNYLSFLVNGTVRGGFPASRPGIRKLEIDYGGNEGLQDGLFQGASVFTPRGGKPCIVASISGMLFKYDLGVTNTVTNVTPQITIGGVTFLDQNSAQLRQAWMLQKEDWLIVQNGQSRPIFLDATSSRRAGDGELRPGCMMADFQGRVWVVNPDRQTFTAGDQIYGPSGTAALGYRDAVLKMTEDSFLNEGGEFAVPVAYGRINSIRVITILDQSMGQGPLQVGTDKAVFSINAPADRTTWKDLAFPIETATLIGNGPLAQDSTINVNGDLWFRSKDGIRSLIIGVRDFKEPGNTPLSREMNRVLEADDKRLLGFGSSILFENRLLMTGSPENSFLHGTYHRGVIALDFDIVSSMSDRLPPAYDGLWTGIRVLKLIAGDFGGIDRAFAFVLSSEDKIELWEITRNDPFDNLTKRIEWFYETPTLFDGNELLTLSHGYISIRDLVGRADFDIKFRPDEYSGWVDIPPWSECANYQTCTLENCEPPMNLQPQYRQKMGWAAPPDECLPEDRRPPKFGYTFQFRVGITGAVRVKKFMAVAQRQDESPYANPTCADAACISTDVCNPPLFSYSAEV